jgi:hypothetical protein
MRSHFSFDSAFWGLGFIVAYFTVHIRIVPGLPGEYQPVAMLFLGLFALLVRPVSSPGFFSWGLLFGLALLIPLVWHIDRGTLQITALVRCFAGLAFLSCAPALIAMVPLQAFNAIILIHASFAVWGLIWPAPLVAVLGHLGLRGVDYYDGWNAYLASEPSYAVLDLAGIVALIQFRRHTSSIQARCDWMLVIAAFVMLMSRSVTGVGFALIFVIGFVINYLSLRRLVRLVASGLIVLFTSLVFLRYSPDLEGSRLHAALVAVSEAWDAQSVTLLFSMEPSGAWRFLTNLTGFMACWYYPLGIGSLDLQNVILQIVPAELAELIAISMSYSGAQTAFNAQVPIANIALFGGGLPVAALLAIFAVAITRVFRMPSRTGIWLVMCYVLVAFLWQSSLTAPGLWLVLGGALTWRPHAESARPIISHE